LVSRQRSVPVALVRADVVFEKGEMLERSEEDENEIAV
jgi:hypothetical protein